MVKKITKASVDVDPVAAWLNPEIGDLVPRKDEQAVATTSTNVPDTPAELAGRYCTACGEKSTAVARFCSACGKNMDPLPVSESFAVAAASSPTFTPVEDLRPKPDALLTPAERAERERLHAEAVRLGSQDPPIRYQPPTGQRPTVLIHFREDGLSFAGVVWMRGQEIELEEGSPRWVQAQAWINQDEFAQMAHYGKVMFGKGPWPGRRSYTAALEGLTVSNSGVPGMEGSAPRYDGPSLEELKVADQAEARRRRGVPAIPM